MTALNKSELSFTSTNDHDYIEALLKNSEVEVDKRKVVLCIPKDAGVVIGSTQKMTHELERYAKAHSSEIHRRSSGGSAVVIDPINSIWLDIFLPPNDPLAKKSIEETFEVASVGWKAILESGGVDAETYRGAYLQDPQYREICFAGRAHGEILVKGKKVVGMAQRRRRIGTYIHTMTYVDFPYSSTMEAAYGVDISREDRERLNVGSLSDFGDFHVDHAETYLEIFTAALNGFFG